MKKVLVTGGSGFIGGYLVEQLLEKGYTVWNIDNLSKYGSVEHTYDHHSRYKFIEADVKISALLYDLLEGAEHFICLAAMIGGITYFHEFAYDLLAENERIMASQFDAAIKEFKRPGSKLKKITVMSSSMVYESTKEFPSSENSIFKNPPPISTYGFQKLATHYFCSGAYEQYKLPFTLLLPFNCVGIGEKRALCDSEIMSGNIKLAMSHVIPDLVQKVLKGQNPLRILGAGNQVRHFTSGYDIARGIIMSLESEATTNMTYNLSTPIGHRIIDLAKIIWEKINGDKPFAVAHDEPFKYDVQYRCPETSRAAEDFGFYATDRVEDILDEVIPWIKDAIKKCEI